MAEPLLLDGTVETNTQSRREQQRLEDEIRGLRRDLEDAVRDKEQLARSVENLRAILSPLYRGMRAIFGEIELAVGENEPSMNSVAIPSQGTVDPRWQSYKTSFPGVPSEIIDALLIHGEMKLTNLSKLIKRHYETTRKAVYKLRDAGAIAFAGGVLSLKR